MSRSSKYAAGAVLFAFALLAPALPSFGQDDKKASAPKDAPLPKEITWKVKALDQAPTKVIAARYDARKHVAFWVLELVRDLTMDEDGTDWAPAFRDGGRTFVSFELHDADGVVIKSGRARYYGEYVHQKGKRFGVILELPPEVIDYVKTVEAVVR